MRLGPLVVLAWMAVMLLSFAAIGLHAARHGARGLATSLLCPLGGTLMYGFISAFIGLAEGVWGFRSPGLWIAIAFGVAGAALEVLGWRAVLRSRIRAGHCPRCGYDLAGLSVCPECGRSMPPGRQVRAQRPDQSGRSARNT